MNEPTRSDGGLLVEVRDRVAYATLDRPERLNALSVALTNDLADAFDSFSNDPGIWAVLPRTGRAVRPALLAVSLLAPSGGSA